MIAQHSDEIGQVVKRYRTCDRCGIRAITIEEMVAINAYRGVLCVGYLGRKK
jgi:transcriptional regulator NrdR family protein